VDTPVRPLSIDADLTLDLGRRTIRITGGGDLVVVDAPSFRALGAVLRCFEALPTSATAARRALSAAVDVELRVRGASVARLRPAAAPGLLGRIVGLPVGRLNLGGLAVALVRGAR
jgi:hypothetical protein